MVSIFTELFIGIVLVQISLQSECGKKLESGAIICLLANKDQTIDTFDFGLCTHATIMSPVAVCENDTCSFPTVEASEKSFQWARPHYPGRFGLFVPLIDFMKDYLSTELRRSNTAEAIANYMKKRGLNFLVLKEVWSSADRTTPEQSENIVTFMKVTAEVIHARGFHIGLMLPLSGRSFISYYDVKTLSNFIDWFSIVPLNSGIKQYMEALLPLSSENSQVPGSTKYWIEHALELIKPECLLLDLGAWGRKSTAANSAVEPGIGSLIETNSTDDARPSDICYELLIDTTCREHWDEESNTPWVACGNIFYSYDNSRSLRLKINLAQRYNVTRILTWGADFNLDNICGDGDPLVFLKSLQGVRNESKFSRNHLVT